MNKKVMNILLACSILGLFSLLSCGESEEQNDLNQAQDCLNKALPANAAACRTLLVNHHSKEAYTLRCASDFLAEGVTATKMAEALEKRDATDTTNNALLGMMGIISFSTEALLDQADADCSRSGYPSYVMLAKMAKISTKIATVGGLTISAASKPTQTEMETALATAYNGGNPSSDTKETVGAAAQIIKNDYCNADNATSKVCTTVTTAIGSNTTNQAIGNELLVQLQNR
ncbi:MAG: hypothetical protein HQK52_21510 [Oligoflexia bacterium]|nr:hypothetical protein [Oligoflexia bacterium]